MRQVFLNDAGDIMRAETVYDANSPCEKGIIIAEKFPIKDEDLVVNYKITDNKIIDKAKKSDIGLDLLTEKGNYYE